MLFVAGFESRLMSMRAQDCTCIFVRESGPMTVATARIFLRGFQPDDFWFQQALRDELQGGSSDLHELLEAAARAIASSATQIARPLVGRHRFRFYPERPWSDRLGTIGFPTRALAHGFTDAILQNQAASIVLQTTLRHVGADHARQLVGGIAEEGAQRTGPIRDQLAQDGWTIERIARLLADGWLLLRSETAGGRVLRFAWPRRGAGAAETTEPEDVPEPAPRRSSAPAGPRSVVPEAAWETTAQALALMAAAAAGVAFCQECPSDTKTSAPANV